jgi:hypothetical protein
MQRFLSASEDHSDPLVVQFHLVGLSVAHGFQWQVLNEPARRGLARAAVTAQQLIDHAYLHAAEIVNGWRYTMAGGRAGHDHALRPALASNLLGANVPEQMLYPNCRIDNGDERLTGANRYVMSFEQGQGAPVSLFWSLSMYDEQEFCIENDLKRYSIGSTTDGLTIYADTSITLSIQHDDPGSEVRSNGSPRPPAASTPRCGSTAHRRRSSTAPTGGRDRAGDLAAQPRDASRAARSSSPCE